MSDWDAARYHRVSDPQRSWGLRVLERLAPAPGERILDLGCGTGRLTSEIGTRVPSARLIGVDRSATMLAEARLAEARLAEAGRSDRGAVTFVQANAASLPFQPSFDAVFSTATFHWIPDHPALFAEIHRVLRPGGRLVSQAGGGPNLARLYRRATILAQAPARASRFAGWLDPWTFAGVEDTRQRLEQTGFSAITVGLEAAPTTFESAAAFSEFVATVCLRHHLDRLPPEERPGFMDVITAQAAGDAPPFTLDYWRLNIDARKD